MVFSHGMTTCRTIYQCPHAEFASHGYIVFAIDHLDGSASYTELSNGTQFCFNKALPGVYDEGAKDYIKNVRVREQEIILLLNEMSEKGFEQNKLGFAKGVKIDVDDVVAAGHSLGGATALLVGESDTRIKAVVTLDPWLVPLMEMIEQKKFTNLS